MLPAVLRSCTRRRQCIMSPGIRSFSSGTQSHNNAIIEMLKKERETYTQEPEADGYKIRALSNAIKVIERLEKPITSGKEAMKLKGIGFGIADRITAFLDSQQPHDPTAQLKQGKDRAPARGELLQIPGLGIKKTQELIEAGCKGIADLRCRKFMPMLSRKQQIFVKYLDHINNPITREQAEAVAQFMRDNLSSKYEIIVAGDYRRGLKSFPLLEIILLHPDHVQVPIPDPPCAIGSHKRLARSLAIRQKYLSVAKRLPNPLHGDAVPNLQNRGLICDTTANGDRKWSGIVHIPERVEGFGFDGKTTLVWGAKQARPDSDRVPEGIFRLMTIVLTPQKARPATLLAMTGDPEFLKYIRYKALSLGLYLDEFGLWRWHSRSNSGGMPASTMSDVAGEGEAEENATDDGTIDGYWELVQVSTEEDIFSVLGMEYVQPERRNFGYLKVKTKRP